jgi:hypothetical protein
MLDTGARLGPYELLLVRRLLTCDDIVELVIFRARLRGGSTETEETS